MWYRISVGQGEIAELRMRLRPAGSQPDRATAIGGDFTRVVAQRRGEADEFYGELTPAQASDDEAAVMRQAFAGMLWSKQFYNYDVARWLDGDPALPTFASGATPAGPQRKVAQLPGIRRDVDARHLGVPLVCRLGLGISLRCAGAHRSLVRQVPAVAAVPGVVSAPHRGGAGVRMGLFRRQSTGACVGGAGSVRHRRRP